MSRTTTTTTSTCGSCGAAIPDGYLCRSCTRELREALADLAPGRQLLPTYAEGPAGRGASTRWDTPSAVLVGGLANHLDTTVTRLARIGDRTTGGSEKPILFHEKAADIRQRLLRTLLPWATWLLATEKPAPTPAPCSHRSYIGADCPCVIPAAAAHARRTTAWRNAHTAISRGDLAALAAYVLPRLHLAAAQDAITQLHRDTVDAVDRLTHIIDTPDVVMAAGACGHEHPDGTTCRRKLYADPAEPYVTCPTCSTRWPVAVRRRELLAAAEDVLETAAGIATALTSLNEPVTADRIYQWKKRGRLVQHGADQRGAPLYRLGDVVDLLAEDMRKAEERRAKSGASRERKAS